MAVGEKDIFKTFPFKSPLFNKTEKSLTRCRRVNKNVITAFFVYQYPAVGTVALCLNSYCFHYASQNTYIQYILAHKIQFVYIFYNTFFIFFDIDYFIR